MPFDFYLESQTGASLEFNLEGNNAEFATDSSLLEQLQDRETVKNLLDTLEKEKKDLNDEHKKSLEKQSEIQKRRMKTEKSKLSSRGNL